MYADDYQRQLDQIRTLPQEQQNPQLLQLGKTLDDSHQYVEAISVYKQTLKSSPCLEEATQTWIAIADAYLKNNQLEEGLSELEAMALLLPENEALKQKRFNVLVTLARASSAQGQAPKAVEYYQRALEADPKNRLQILREYADQLTYAAQAHLAIPLYQEVLAANPSKKEKRAALIGLARAFTWRENYQDAIATNHLVLQLDPNYNQYEFFITLAKDAGDHGKPQIAVKYYEKAFKIEPSKKQSLIRDYAKQLSYAGDAQQSIVIYLKLLDTNLSPEERRLTELDLGQAFVWTHQYPLALERYNALLAKNANDVEANKGIAQVYIDYGNFNGFKQLHKEASEWYLKALELDPSRRREILLLDADQLTLNSQPGLAIPKYLEILSCYPTPEMHYRAKFGLAKAYLANGQYHQGLALLDEMLKVNPNDRNIVDTLLTTYINFARHDAQTGNHTSAINWYLSAMSLDPKKRSGLLREYAVELSNNGQPLQAIPLFKEILDGHPSAEEARLTKLDLAQAYRWSNQHKEALKIYDQLLNVDPADAQARRGKAQVYIDYARYDAGTGNHSQSIYSYKEAIVIDPTLRLQLLKDLAVQFEYNSDSSQAISVYKKILDSNPSQDEARSARLNLARIYASKFQYEEALKEYDFLLQQNQYDQMARQGKAQVYVEYARYNSKKNLPAEAIDWYRKAMENDPILRPQLLKEIEEENVKLEKVKQSNKAPSDSSKAPSLPNQPKQPVPVEQVKEEKQVKEAAKDAQHDKAIDTEASQSKPEVIDKAQPTKKENKLEEPDKQEQSCKEYAKQEYEAALEFAKHLDVFQANRAFKRSIESDPYNGGYREAYAWHLQAFSFIEEAVPQFYWLLSCAQDQDPFYTTLGWDLRSLGKLDDSIWAFSHLYPVPCCFTLSNQFILIGNLYREGEYEKIRELQALLNCESDGKEGLTTAKKLFETYAYLGEVEEAGFFADQILYFRPDEYMVQYRYAYTLYQKRLYCQSISQYHLLLEKLPNNAFLYLSLGKVYEDMGFLQEAREAYRTSLRLDHNSKTERAYARILSKLGCCCEAESLANEMMPEDNGYLTKSLSLAETSLNCGDAETASTIYREILDEYPYNQEALWGLLEASTITMNFSDARLSYRRWPTIWFDYPYQNYLAPYYRSPELLFSSEYFGNSVKFNHFAAGVSLSQYVGCDTRITEGYYYTRFSQRHFDTVDRHTGTLTFQKFLNEKWEGRIGLIENFYHNLQRTYSDQLGESLYSKGVFNYHFHLLSHVTDELTVDVGYDYYDVIDTIPPFDNLIYNYSIQIGAAALNIRTADVNVFFNYTKDRFSLMGNWVTGKYSDGNTKEVRSIRTDYKICEIPVVNVFYSYFFLDFQNPAPLFTQNGFTESAYYDPRNFEIHVIGINSTYDICDILQVGGEATTVYIPKCENFGYSGDAFIDYLFADQWSLRLDLRYFYQNRSVNRNGITGYYSANSANLQLRYQF